MTGTTEASSWFLDGRTGWRGQVAEAISVGRDLSLRPSPSGPLALVGDGSLGGLRLPPRVAVDPSGRIHLLRVVAGDVVALEPGGTRFVRLSGVGGPTGDARGLSAPVKIAINGDLLWIVDAGSRRVVAFDLRSRTLVEAWGPTADRPWQPADLACHGERILILDQAHGRVYVSSRGRSPRHMPISGLQPGDCSAITVDGEGRLYLLADRLPILLVRAPDGSGSETALDAGSVRDRFAPPVLRIDHRGRIHPPGTTIAFDLDGRPVDIDPYEPAGPRSFERRGTWTTTALDSRIHDCQWHRVELELASLPAGSSVMIRTFAANEPPPSAIPPELWMTTPQIRGADRTAERPTTIRPAAHDVLVQSRPGRYLVLQVVLESDGYETPRIDWIRVLYPRQSLAEYLPAVFSAEADTGTFLDRFLSLFQTEWDRIGGVVATSARYFDPATAPDDGFLAFLASWLALPLEGEWDTPQRRRLLAAARTFYPVRGTLTGLQHVLAIYLQNIARLDRLPEEFPSIIEGFRERRYQILSDTPSGPDAPRPIWGPDLVGRLQLDAGMREGEARLVSTGDPERDVFQEYAHRFRVFVPSGWVATSDDEAMLRRAIDAERPAHTQYQLSLVEPRFRVGIQSMVGVDTVLGEYPQARLRRPEDPVPPSRPSAGRLGVDTVLAKAPPIGPGLRLDSATHLGSGPSLR